MYLLVLVENESRQRKKCRGQMKGLNVNISIKFEEFLGKIYRISGINYVEYNSIMMNLYNVKPLVSTFVISNQEDFHFLFTSDDVSEVVVFGF